MTQYNNLYVTLSNSQLIKLKSELKNVTQVTLRLSSSVFVNSNDKTANFPQKLSLTNTQVSKPCKTFASGLLANMKLSKTQLFKMIQLRGLSLTPFSLLGSIRPVKIIISIANSDAIELKNKDLMKEIENKDVGDLLVDTELNILGEKKLMLLVKMLKKKFQQFQV